MTHARRLAMFAAAVLPLALAGCGGTDACPTGVAKVSSAPTCPVLAAGRSVTIRLPLCTRCNQTGVTCQVDPPQGGSDVTFQLDTAAQECTDPSSCPPDDGSCPLAPAFVECRFTTPLASGIFNFLVIGPDGNPMYPEFEVAETGADSCG